MTVCWWRRSALCDQHAHHHGAQDNPRTSRPGDLAKPSQAAMPNPIRGNRPPDQSLAAKAGGEIWQSGYEDKVKDGSAVLTRVIIGKRRCF